MKRAWDDHIESILFSPEDIATRIQILGQELSVEYEGKNPILVGVLNGASVFLVDLIRAMSVELRIDFVSCSSYGDAMTPGAVKIVKDMNIGLF